ncbi:type VI secretion system baseplate subunit TssK [Massilia sp. S19_KUP03_FR1]|uniref:type VI secretion system baseplate subunit TssK n=1 Tax=Massilia sp. S19_KUP03_FR1 TaxID=3025503 RepID=UPI002FCD95A4
MSGKVLWGEGLFLRPHHFQQQDQYHEQRLHASLRAVHPFAWGVQHLEVDVEALASGKLRLLRLSLRFPDGELVDAPGDDASGDDALPAPIDLDPGAPAGQAISYYAALPALKPFGGNFSQPGQASNAARFVQANQDTPDLYTKAEHAQLAYLKKTLRLVSEFEPRDAYTHLPLLRVRALGDGAFTLDPGFVAPSLSIESAAPLHQQLRVLQGALQARVAELLAHHREPNRNVIEFRSGDIASFWLLHTASAACATLSHHLHHPTLHPERLYEQLLGVAGALMTFSKQWVLADLPAYQHGDPGPCFATVHRIIHELLGTVISNQFVDIALEQVRPCYYQGSYAGGKVTDTSTFYLAVAAAMPALELVQAVPLRFKVGAPDDVDNCVLSATPGVRLTHAAEPPTALPVRPGMCYFGLDVRGPMIERMKKAQTVSIYVPSTFAELKLQLFALTT